MSPRPLLARVGRLAVAPAVLATLALPARGHAQAPVLPTADAAPAAAGAAVSAPVLARIAAIPDPRARAAVAEVLADAQRRRLPVAPLVAKALEGVEKQAPPARIEAAVRAMAGRLGTAGDALAPAQSEAELTAGADALAVGVPSDVLRRMRDLAPRRSTAVPLGVLAQLVSRGVPVPRAAVAVASLVQRRANEGQFLALGRAVQEDMATGVSAAQALELRSRALIMALPAPGAPSGGGATLMGTPNTPKPARP